MNFLPELHLLRGLQRNIRHHYPAVRDAGTLFSVSVIINNSSYTLRDLTEKIPSSLQTNERGVPELCSPRNVQNWSSKQFLDTFQWLKVITPLFFSINTEHPSSFTTWSSFAIIKLYSIDKNRREKTFFNNTRLKALWIGYFIVIHSCAGFYY